MSHVEDPAFDYDNDLESGYDVPVINEEREYGSVTRRPPLTPIGMSVREERSLYRTSNDLGAAARERELHAQRQ